MQLPPVIPTSKLILVHVCRFDLSFLTAVNRETPPLLIIELQHTLIDAFLSYFKTLNETIIRSNFSTIYQILDEMVDGAFPYTTELNQLHAMVIPPTVTRRMFEAVSGKFAVAEKVPAGALSKIPWRKGDCKYVTNEIYFDIIEQIDATFGPNGLLLHSTIYGDIKAQCRLSGMPDLTLTFTKPNLLADASLHRCVRINRFQREKVVSFVPPDGAFKLLSFRINGNTNTPLYLKPQITYGENGTGRVFCQVGSRNTGNLSITDVSVVIPLNRACLSTNLTANVGSIRQDAKTKVVRWEIGNLPKDKTPILEGSMSLPADFKTDERPTIRGEFQVKMYCASGLKVDGLAIRGVKYKPFKGVRSVTQAGRFQFRT
jgi:AP-3 complex subunit mu